MLVQYIKFKVSIQYGQLANGQNRYIFVRMYFVTKLNIKNYKGLNKLLDLKTCVLHIYFFHDSFLSCILTSSVFFFILALAWSQIHSTCSLTVLPSWLVWLPRWYQNGGQMIGLLMGKNVFHIILLLWINSAGLLKVVLSLLFVYNKKCHIFSILISDMSQRA